MNIPNHIHFGLGFGFKYQYLLSTLLHALMTDNNLLSFDNKEACKKYMIKKLEDTPLIHVNVPYFMEQITNIFPDIKNLNYNKNALLLLEGEDGCFEDINLFTTNSSVSKINFMQVKGSDTNSNSALNKAIKKTLTNMVKNDNTQILFELTIFINDTVTSWYYLRDNDDKIKMMNAFLKNLIKVDKYKGITLSLKTEILRIFDLYLSELYSGKVIEIYSFFSQHSTANEYKKIKLILSENNSMLNDFPLVSILNKLKIVIDNTRVIDRLDHRLIYLFLKHHYGNDKLTKVLWNIEMKSMSAESVSIKDIKEELRKINFMFIDNIKFSKNLTSTVFKKGKIL